MADGTTTKVYVLGFSAALAISTTCAAREGVEVELKRANAGVRLAAKAVMGRRWESMKRRAAIVAIEKAEVWILSFAGKS